jgi:hypothetical protein
VPERFTAVEPFRKQTRVDTPARFSATAGRRVRACPCSDPPPRAAPNPAGLGQRSTEAKPLTSRGSLVVEPDRRGALHGLRGNRTGDPASPFAPTGKGATFGTLMEMASACNPAPGSHGGSGPAGQFEIGSGGSGSGLAGIRVSIAAIVCVTFAQIGAPARIRHPVRPGRTALMLHPMRTSKWNTADTVRLIAAIIVLYAVIFTSAHAAYNRGFHAG